MARVEGIIFDKDGTLFDFRRTWASWAASVLHAVFPDDPEGQARGGDALGFDPVSCAFRADSVLIAGNAQDLATALLPMSDLNRGALVTLADGLAARVAPVPAVALHPCLDALGAGRVLGLVTNDSEAAARVHLDATGIAGFFDFVAGYDSGHGAKPDPGPLLAFAEATGIDPAATLMVGDSTHDLVSGRRAGMVPVGVLTGVADADELAPHAEVVLDDIDALSEWIASRGG